MAVKESQTLTSFNREYIIGDGNNVAYGFQYKVIVTGSSIIFEFGKEEKRVQKIIAATFQNELFIYNGNLEVLTIKICSKFGTEIKLTVSPPWDMEQIFAMIGAGFGIFILNHS